MILISYLTYLIFYYLWFTLFLFNLEYYLFLSEMGKNNLQINKITNKQQILQFLANQSNSSLIGQISGQESKDRIIMFPTSLQHPYAPRGRRRGRNDPNSRDYICPCGKSYLSYPALFTHIKIKHNGRAPGQIIKPKSQNPSKRGRPRQKQVYDSDSDTNDMAANCIDRLCDFVTEFDKPQQSLCSGLKDLYMKDPFYRVYVDYNPQQQQPRYNEREDLYQEYSDNVFCELIAEVNKRLNEPYHVDCVMVLLMLLGNFVNQETLGDNLLQQNADEEDGYEEGYADNQQDQDYDNQKSQILHNNNNNNPSNYGSGMIVPQEQQYHSSSQQKQQKEQLGSDRTPHLINNNGQLRQKSHNSPSRQQFQQQEEQLFDSHNNAHNNTQDPLQKLKNEPIKNIVNYLNDFIISYNRKYYQPYHLQSYPFLSSNNLKIFMELFFNWLTMKKYLGYKVKINQHYQ